MVQQIALSTLNATRLVGMGHLGSIPGRGTQGLNSQIQQLSLQASAKEACTPQLKAHVPQRAPSAAKINNKILKIKKRKHMFIERPVHLSVLSSFLSSPYFPYWGYTSLLAVSQISQAHSHLRAFIPAVTHAEFSSGPLATRLKTVSPGFIAFKRPYDFTLADGPCWK